MSIYYIIYLDLELQVSRRSSRSVLEYRIEHGQKLCAPYDIINKRLRLWYYIIASLTLVGSTGMMQDHSKIWREVSL